MSHWEEFDYVVINDDLDEAVEAFAAIVDGRPGALATADAAVRRQIEAILGTCA